MIISFLLGVNGTCYAPFYLSFVILVIVCHRMHSIIVIASYIHNTNIAIIHSKLLLFIIKQHQAGGPETFF